VLYCVHAIKETNKNSHLSTQESSNFSSQESFGFVNDFVSLEKASVKGVQISGEIEVHKKED